jgi:hypothetical protein
MRRRCKAPSQSLSVRHHSPMEKTTNRGKRNVINQKLPALFILDDFSKNLQSVVIFMLKMCDFEFSIKCTRMKQPDKIREISGNMGREQRELSMLCKGRALNLIRFSAS